MPEGPEVYALTKLLLAAGIGAVATGKRLHIGGTRYTFGLHGGLHVDAKGVVSHVARGKVSGGVDGPSPPLGLDWMSCTRTQVAAILKAELAGRRACPGAWVLDQSHIAGVGVAWGSEILAEAGVRPDVPAKDQDLGRLAEAYIAVRDRVRAVYDDFVAGTRDAVAAVNAWPANLYAVRPVAVYYVGTPVAAGGRTFWVK